MNKTYIIAEIAQGFEGNPWLCKKFIELAKESGADAVKFQIFNTNELCTPTYKYFELFKSLEINSEIWTSLINFAKSIDIDFISDIFGIETLMWISKTDISGFKIHSTDLKNFELLEMIGKSGKQIYLSTGGSELDEIDKAISFFHKDKLVLLSGFQAEPNKLSDVELDKISFLKNRYNLRVGYADHIDPHISIASVLPAIAVSKGADVIEKHLTIERDFLKIEDYISALNPAEFKKMVEMIRDVELFSITGNTYNLNNREFEYRLRMKKNVVALKNIRKDQKITSTDVALLRTGFDTNTDAFFDVSDVIGCTASQNIGLHEIILKNSILKN